MIGRPIQVRGTSYDGHPHWSHPAYLVLQRGSLIVTQTFAGAEVTTRNGLWTAPWHARGHYWADSWYNVIRLEAPHGVEAPGAWGASRRAFYCNVATPAEFDGENLHYCDLQLDVVVFAGEDGTLRAEVRDENEFEEACERLRYPDSVVREARAAVDELIRLIETRQFPFNV